MESLPSLFELPRDVGWASRPAKDRPRVFMDGQLAVGDVHSPQTACFASVVDSEQELRLAVLIRIGGRGLVVDVSGWRSSRPPSRASDSHSTWINQMGSCYPRHDCVPKDSSGVDAGKMRKERPRILDRDGLTHEMDESTDTTRPHTCPECGTTRSRNAVPYLVPGPRHRRIQRAQSAAPGSSTGQWALRAGPMRMASARLRGERENVSERDPCVHRR